MLVEYYTHWNLWLAFVGYAVLVFSIVLRAPLPPQVADSLTLSASTSHNDATTLYT